MSAKTAEQNEASIARLTEELRTGLARLPQLVVENLGDGFTVKIGAGADVWARGVLVILPAHLRSVLTTELDRLERVAQQLASIEQIEHRRREQAADQPPPAA